MKFKTALKVGDDGHVYISAFPVIGIIMFVLLMIIFTFYVEYSVKEKNKEMDKKYEQHQKEEKNQETGTLIYPYFEMRG
jgi:phosphotransferase system  glucose/maltose/N-acetylglucosamine-specific IIC component